MEHKPINYKNEYHKLKEEIGALKESQSTDNEIKMQLKNLKNNIYFLEQSKLRDAEFYVNKIKSLQDWVYILSVFLIIESIFILIKGLGFL